MKLEVMVWCSSCDKLYEKTVDEHELRVDYTCQADGSYHYDRGDCWCDRCEEEDMRCITRDYYPPNWRGHKV